MIQVMTDQPPYVNAGPIVDRGPEFDQTVRHDHAAGEPCHCGWTPPPASPAETPADFERDCPNCSMPDGRHRPPCVFARAEDRRLSSEPPVFTFADLEARDAAWKERLRVATERIAGFENFVRSFAEKLDAMQADVIFLTGKSFDEWLADFREEKKRSAIAAGRCWVDGCVLTAEHDGPCSRSIAA